MIIKAAGLLIAYSILIHIWLIAFTYRQKIYSFFIPIYIYFNILLAVLGITAILMFRDTVDDIQDAIFKIFFITQAFLPPILIQLSEKYSLSTSIPRVSLKNIFFFSGSLFLSCLAILDWMIIGGISAAGFTYPNYSGLYWLFLLFFDGAIIFVIAETIGKYRRARRGEERAYFRSFIYIVLPFSTLIFSGLQILPFFGIIHPFIFLFLPLATALTVYSSFKINLFNYDEDFSKSVSFLVLIFLFTVVLFFLPLKINYGTFLLLIPVACVLYLIYNTIYSVLMQKVKSRNIAENYELDLEFENFTGGIGRYFEESELAEYISKFSSRVLRCTKSAIILSRFDIKPYEILFNAGFEPTDLEMMLSKTTSPILETIESDYGILNKTDYSQTEGLFQAMDRYKLYLCVPMVAGEKLIGIILLGGDRKNKYFSHKDIRFVQFLSAQSASAFQNTQAIQNAIQAEKMAELGVLASQIAHDFQSFITLVKLDTPVSNRLREHANYMEKLVQDLLNYARPQDLRLSVINVNQLIDMTLDLLVIPKTVAVEKHYSNSIPEISIDNNQIQRAFINLLENSIQTMKEKGGRLKISTKPLRPISSVKRNPWIYIEFLDEGNGIPEEFLDKIFEPFFTTRRHEGGNGMGLAIVKQIITRHKGFIDVTSKQGKGTIFNIRLPYLK